MPNRDCVGAEDLRAYLVGDLPDPLALAVSAHLDTCPDCEAAAQQLDDLADPLMRSLQRALGTDAWPGQHRNEPAKGGHKSAPHVADAPAPELTVAVARDPQSAEEIQTLLRKRLRFFTAWNGAAFAAYAASILWIPVEADAVLMYWAILGLNGGLAWLLFSRRPLSLSCLRWIEGIVFASTALMFTRMHWMFYTWEPALQSLTKVANDDWHHLVLLARGLSLNWFILITAYGLLIPNTWRRCAAVVSVMALWPVLLNAALALPDRPFETRITLVVESGINMVVAVALAIYGSYRIETLRRQAAHAGKLGPYQLKRRLGAGGMGEVYLAEHALLRRPCAVKLIRPERAGDPRNLARFEREVQATVTLSHPNIVEIFDYGHTEDGTFYYVMEYLPGLNLEELVRRHSPLPPGRAVHLLRQVCGALQEAHAAGLIHRDIKPGNILVCQRGGRPDVAKLLDFGLVQAHGLNQDGHQLTQEGAIAGTPAYMSPEQGACRDLDARSDLYSLGAMAYFLLTGRPPFVRGSAVQTLAAHLGEPVVAPDRHRPDVPADLQAVVLRCLEKDSARRFPDADEFAQALARCRCADQWTREQAAAWWRDSARGDPQEASEGAGHPTGAHALPRSGSPP